MKTRLGPTFVFLSIAKRDTLRILFLTLLLATAACSDPAEEAGRDAALAEQFLLAGNLPAAREAIHSALSHRDGEIDILLLDALIKFRMQDYGAAYDSYRVILAIDPNNITALVGVAQLGLATGNIRQSSEAIDRALAIDPRQPEALLSKGVIALDKKDYSAAIAIGDQLTELLPDDPRGIVLRARGQFLKGESAASMKLLRDAAARIGNNGMIASALLENARAAGNVPVMLEQFYYLREANPGSADLAIDEANVRYKSGDLLGARDVGLEILDSFSDDADTLARLGDLWREYDAGPLTGQTIAKLAPELGVEARLMIARYLYGKGKIGEAASAIRELNDDRGVAIQARIDVSLGRRGGLERATAIVQRDTSNCDALAAIAEWHLSSGKANQAVVPAQVIASECADRNDGFLILARAYIAADRTAAVERVFREGIDTHPRDPVLVETFARWLLLQGRTRPSISAARRLTNAAPSRVSSWRLYADICQRTGDDICVEIARSGMDSARRDFRVDLLPGQLSVNPLLGRTWR